MNKRDIRRFLITVIRSCLRSGEISLWGDLLVCRLLTRFWNIWCGIYSIFLFPAYKVHGLLERKFLNQSIRSINFCNRRLKKQILMVSICIDFFFSYDLDSYNLILILVQISHQHYLIS